MSNLFLYSPVCHSGFVLWANLIAFNSDAVSSLEFKGKGIEEKGIVKSIHGDSCPGIKKGDTIVEVVERYFRPAEVETLLGDPSKAKNKLGWELEITFDQMIAEMIEKDLDTAKKSKLLLDHGYDVNLSLEDK